MTTPELSGSALDDEPLPTTLAAAIEEIEEYRQIFNLRWEADRRAIRIWRGAHPGKEMTWPDHADLCMWLMGQLEEKKARADATRA